MIKFILKFFPFLLDLAKIGNKTYYRLSNSNQPWKVIDRKIKIKKSLIRYRIPEESITEGEITLTGVDRHVTKKQCLKMAIQQLEAKSRKELHQLWWAVTPLKQQTRWRLSWVSLRHKDINN